MSSRQPPTFGQAFRAARRSMKLSQRSLGPLFQVKGRTLVRWESDESMPANVSRPSVVAWLRSLGDNPHAIDALLALDVILPASPPAPQAAAPRAPALPPEVRARKLALEHALLLAAEAHDVPSRGARQVVAAVLEAIEAEGVSLATARALLAPPEARAKG